MFRYVNTIYMCTLHVHVGPMRVSMSVSMYNFVHVCIRAVPISLLADCTDTACSRLLKQAITIMRPIMTLIMKGRL